MVRKKLLGKIFILILMGALWSAFNLAPVMANVGVGALQGDSQLPTGVAEIGSRGPLDSMGSYSKAGSTPLAPDVGIIETHGEWLHGYDLNNLYTDLGYVVDTVTAVITLDVLNNYDFVVVGDGGSAWDPSEIAAVHDYIGSGGGFVVVADEASASVLDILDDYGISYAGVGAPGGSSSYFDPLHPIMQGVSLIYAPNPANSLTFGYPAYWIANDASDTYTLVAGAEAVGKVLCLCDDFAYYVYNDDNEIMFENIAKWMTGKANIGIVETHGEQLQTEVLADYYRSLGYVVEKITTTITPAVLDKYDMLIVGEYGSAWDPSEIAAVHDFIASGKGFVAIGDELYTGVLDILDDYGISYAGVGAPGGSSSYFDPLHPIMQGVSLIYPSNPVESLTLAYPAYWIANEASNTYTVIAGAEAVGKVLCLSNDFENYVYNDDNEIMFRNIADWMCARAYVVFEEAHYPIFTIGDNPGAATGAYSEFADYLNASGYMVSTINPGTTISSSVLAWVDVLVIAAPDNSYSTSELNAIENWVKGGGSLLLISDFDGYGDELSAIATRFDITLALDLIEDSDEYVSTTSSVYYDGANLLPHQVTAGVSRVEMYSGDGIASAPGDEVPLIVTDTDGTATWSYAGTPAYGVSVMSAFDGGTAGHGKLVVITDSNIWDSAYDVDGDGDLNFYDSDNEILALNTIDWLAQPDILVVNDDDGNNLIYGTSLVEFASALTASGLEYWVWDESTMGNPSLDYLSRFKLVIWTTGDYFNEAVDPTDAATLEAYVGQGGNILLEGEDIGYDHHSDSFMVNVAHATYVVDNTGAPGLTVTDPAHPVTSGLPESFTWATTPTYPDGVSPTNGGAEVIAYTGTDYTAVTVFDGKTAEGSVVYYAFPLYCLGTEGQTLTLNSAAWLLGAPRILAYVEYTDYDWEYANSLQAIDSTFGTNYILTELWDYTQLDSMLPGNDILFIPEQEYAYGSVATMEAIGASWSTTLSNFLSQGGVIIVCDYGWTGTGESYGVLTGAGLMSITSAHSITGATVDVVDPSDPLAQGVSSSFTAPNGANRFVTGEGNVVFEYDGTYPVVIHKTVGTGHIALIGFDYYSSNADTEQILGNAVRLYITGPRILAYVEYTDYDWEYANSLQAIDSTFGTNYILTELWDYTQLDSMLPGNDILFIPEQEYAGLIMMEMIGASWSTTLSNFLSQGGTIIVCDHTGGSHGVLTAAGLMSITSTNYITGATVYLVDPSDPLAQGVSSSFTAPNGALAFVTGEGNVVVDDGTNPVVIHKTVGAGHIALIGFDYYSSNADVDQILGNAVGLYALEAAAKAYLFVRGSNNLIYYRTYDLMTETWDSWSSAPGESPNSPAAAVVNNELHLVVRGMSGGQIWHGYVNLADNSFSGFSLLDGSTPSAPTLTATDDGLCLVIRGNNDIIYFRQYDVATRVWGSWVAIPAGTTLSTPAAVVVGDELHLAVRGSNFNQIWHGFVNLVAWTWSGWTLLTGTTPSPPLLTATSTDVCLVVRGDNNAIYYRWYDLATETWGGWNDFPYGLTPDVPAATITGDSLQVVVRGMNADQIWHGTLNLATDVWSGWTLLDGTTPSKPVLTS